MKKKDIESYKKKDAAKLIAEVADIKKDIARLVLDAKVAPLKDSNEISKKKRTLAVILTILREKQIAEVEVKK